MLKIITSFCALPFDEVLDIYWVYAGRSWDHTSVQEFYGYLRDEFFPDGGVYALWEDGGTYVSAVRLLPWANGMLIAGLETKKQARNLGYATKLLRAVAEYARANEVCCLFSHVHKNNGTSAAVHAAMGFTLLRDNAKLLDGSVVSDHHTLILNL